ncbi:hypothetical protein CBR_g38266 [Chara braunii]|uniref:Exocyst component Exo84 C-terminal domain-containing protein n=1 Tax=Chara braunii TaxID=69332 RepID=A0A388LPM2_CHABU|nr:hypothetical protein CBR_g38266 [Chara braunii]|eukprot:GBG84296.1 hypothetical protein CBR_g38266 [Chara braunii]
MSGHTKTSVRSIERSAEPHGRGERGEVRSGKGGLVEGGVVLEDLRVFESDSFDGEKYVQSTCQSMSEKNIRQLCAGLLELRRISAEEMRKSVYTNYAAFIRTSKEISDLEGELLQMRNLLSAQASLIHGLVEVGSPTGVLSVREGSGPSSSSLDEVDLLEDELEPSVADERAAELPDILDVLLAERKVEDALSLLEEGEKLVSESQNGGHQGGDEDMLSHEAAAALHLALSERRTRLAEQLAESAQQPSVRGAELRAAISALGRLGDGARAHSLLLNSHRERLRNNVRSLRPSGTSYGGAYTAALSQMVFSAIAAAASDSVAVFGDQPAHASELVLWAHAETERCANLLRRHVLSASAAAGGLRAAAECVQIALGYCSLLEESGLALTPVLSKLVRPSVEEAVAANLDRIKESVAALAAVDDWSLTLPQPSQRGVGRTPYSMSANLKLTSSAHKLYSMVQEFLDDVTPVVGMQLTGPTLDGLAQLFEGYVRLLMKALPPTIDDDEYEGVENGEGHGEGHGDGGRVRIAETEAQQLALLGNAAALADELLPRASMQLSRSAPGSAQSTTPTSSQGAAGVHLGGTVGARKGRTLGATTRSQSSSEQQALRRRLQRAVDKLRDAICARVMANLMYGEDSECRPNAELYVRADPKKWEHEQMASTPFVQLFAALTSVAKTAAEVLVNRDRVVTLMLMRLTEALVIALMGDDAFWTVMESNERPLGHIGLQQFILDMHFLMQAANVGRYSSRAMREVAVEAINRAINAYSAQGEDAGSFLQTDQWFQGKAQDALKQLFREWSVPQRTGFESCPDSPTHSISSHHSHGSEVPSP